MGKDVESELAANIKTAKTKRMYFAFVPKGGSDGALVLAKTKISPVMIGEAKTRSGGTQVVKGACFGEDGKLVFEMGKEAPATMEAALKKVIQRDAGIAMHCICRVGTSPDLLEDGEAGHAPPPPPGSIQKPVTQGSPPPPPPMSGAESGSGSPGSTPPVPPPPGGTKQPPAHGPAEQYTARKHEIEPLLIKALKEKHGDETKLKAAFQFALDRAEAKDFVKAIQGLETVAKLIEAEGAAPHGSGTHATGVPPTPPSPGGTPVTPPNGTTPPTGTKTRPVLRRDVPTTWAADEIVTDQLFDALMDVHSGLFDGAPPTALPGVSFAIVDKLAIGTAYVKAQVWDEKEDGAFNPAKNKDHAQMALDMAPAMVTIIPSKDPARTVYVNQEYFEERNGGKPNYDEVNAVMLHEAHHASSKGFVNYPFFEDHDLAWGFDECATEYFTKKVWDSKYPDRKDDYFKYTNYFKDPTGKTGWYGVAGAQLASALGEQTLAAAYFSGGEDALNLLKAKKDEIQRIVKTVK